MAAAQAAVHVVFDKIGTKMTPVKAILAFDCRRA
jgi:hypothetical protein